jgi:hypothetical protein
MAARMEAALVGLRSRTAKLEALGRVYVQFGVDEPAAFRAMFGPTGSEARDPKRRGDHARGPYEILEQVAAEGQRGKVDTATAALILWSGVHGFASLIVDGAIRPTARERDRLLTELLDRLIAAV